MYLLLFPTLANSVPFELMREIKLFTFTYIFYIAHIQKNQF